MKYAAILLLMAGMAILAAAMAASWPSRAAWSWVAFSLLFVAVAYGLNRPGLLGKNSRGHIAWWSWLLLWPYFALVWTSFLWYRLVDRRDAYAQIAPGLYLGRRSSRREMLQRHIEWAAVLDLAAELPRTPWPAAKYLLLPVLDATPPSPAQLRQASMWIDEQLRRGPVFVHCALGHGRSASAVAAWLLWGGLAKDSDSAVTMIQTARPGVGLSAAQRARLHEIDPPRLAAAE